MRPVLLFLIRFLTPAPDREWVIGDILEELDHQDRTRGREAAKRWLRGELWRVCLSAPRHRLATRLPRAAADRRARDGPMSAFSQDLRYALRLLGRSPGFAAIAIVTLALGIGANTAMFAVVNGVLLKRLPFAEAELAD